MKRIAILTLMLVLLATPTLAALKMLEAPLAKELEELAVKAAAARHNVSVEKVEIIDPWLLELFNIKTEVYVVPLVVNGEKVTEYVQVDNKKVLSQSEMEALRADDEKNAPEEPVFRTLAIDMGEEDTEVTVTGTNKPSLLPYAAVFVGLIALGGAAFAIKSRLS